MVERYLTPQEVADLLKIKKNTVYDMIKKGSLRAVKVGKQFRVAEGNVRAVLGQCAPAARAGYQPPTGGERFVVCGQDTLLDLLCDSANTALGEPFFFRSHMGSYNGLHAMYQGQADAATAHLWDMETDTYNLPFIPKLLPGERVAVFHLVGRTVGIYVAAGNPKGIVQIEDFARPGVTMVSREKGSGIRVLADSLFARAGIAPRAVHGYETVAGSHLAAAACVAGGPTAHSAIRRPPSRPRRSISYRCVWSSMTWCCGRMIWSARRWGRCSGFCGRRNFATRSTRSAATIPETLENSSDKRKGALRFAARPFRTFQFIQSLLRG